MRPLNWSKSIFYFFVKRKSWIWINGLNSFKRPYSSITVPVNFNSAYGFFTTLEINAYHVVSSNGEG